MEKFIKIEKNSVWWLVKHLIAVVILYIIYARWVPFGPYQITLQQLPFISFIGWFITSAVIVVGGYILLTEVIGTLIIRKGIFHFSPEVFDGVSLFDVKIPIDDETLKKFDNKFKRTQIKYPDMKKPVLEGDYEFCKRVIHGLVKNALKKGIK